MKWLVESSPFHLFTNPSEINRFLFGQWVVIFYLYVTCLLQVTEVFKIYHYENLPMQYTEIFKVVKNENFSRMFFFFFLYFSYFCSKHRLWVHPCIPQFYYIKVGYKGVYISRICFPDDSTVTLTVRKIVNFLLFVVA